MKKRLFCIGLLFAMIFAFAACGTKTTPPEQGTNDATPNPPSYTSPDYGEKGYVDTLFAGFPSSYSMPKEVLITSMQELQEFREATKDTNLSSNFTDKINSFAPQFFEENVLVSIFRRTASGMYWYTLKGVEVRDDALTVNLQYWQPGGAVTTEVGSWGVLLEYPKGDFSQLKIDVENKYQSREVAGTYVTFVFTDEASLETIYHDYTPADFPELDFDFTLEEYFIKMRDEVRTLLKVDPTNDLVTRFSRIFSITLTEKSKENMLRVIELLEAREEIKAVDPAYEYFWPQE